tara:strand:- start:3447 stop:6086 length:2640 start_codon:yes stop_codon:yes gene_type:complete
MRRGITNKFNRGELDSRALLRDDVDKVVNSCELMENLMPQRLGPMQYRPGSKFISHITDDNYLVPFIARTDDFAIVSFEAFKITMWVDDLLVDQPTGTMTLTNQDFTTDLTGWTDASGAGSTAVWGNARAVLSGFETSAAKIHQTFGGVGIGVEHCIRIVIEQAPVLVHIGETGVDSDDIFGGYLGPGTHFLNFTPLTALPTITLSNSRKYKALVDQVSLGNNGTMEIPLPETITELSSIRTAHSADVLFVATSSTPQFRIERRGKKSWSVVDYRADDGPFGLINNTQITVATAKLDGNATLTASDNLFKTTDVGRLIKHISGSQVVDTFVSNELAGTDAIRVVGVGPVRKFRIDISGGVGTVTLQRSIDNNSWEDVQSYAGNVNKFYSDDLDNSILYYRLYIEAGDYTSGIKQLRLIYESGSIEGIARIITYASATSVGVQMMKPFGDYEGSLDWHWVEWGAKGEYPSAVALYEGRLWWAGKNKLYGSVSDEYASFDDELEGDSAPIRRTIGFGPVDRVDWLAPSSRLIMGVASDEISVRSSSFGTVLSSSNTNLKSGSTQGVAPIEPLKVDDQLLFVQRSGVKIMDTGYIADKDAQFTVDIMTLHPRICLPGIVRMGAARQPETRIYVVLTDGSMRVHLEDPAEDVAAWSRITMDGLIKDVVVMPGAIEDQVYIVIERNGFRNLEKFSQLDAVVDEHYDSGVEYISAGTTLTGLDHLEGMQVLAWSDGAVIPGPIFGAYTVSGGSITLTASPGAKVFVGLIYTAEYKSNKLSAYWATASGASRVLGKVKRIVDFHLAMEDYQPGAVLIGPDFDSLERMPAIEFGKPVDFDAIIHEYDERPFEFNGNADVDSRICMRLSGPATVLAISYGVITEGDVT